MKRIPCGLPHIPPTVLNSSTASLLCADHTLCGVSKHPGLFKPPSHARGSFSQQIQILDFFFSPSIKLHSVTGSC